MQAMTIDPGAPFFVVLNGGSGSQDAIDAKATIERVLGAAGRKHRVTMVSDAARLQDVARSTVEEAKRRGGVVVAAGGDGTINTVAGAALGSGCAFGVLPQGTFNYFSRTHGIPSDTEAATRLLLQAQAHPVQVGLVNGQVFLVNASLGLYPQLLEDREAYKQQYGRSRFVALRSALATLMREHRQLRIQLTYCGETRRIRTPTLFVGNNRLQLEQIGIPEASLIEQGRLAAITLRPVGTLSMLWLMLRGALGKLGDADKVVNFAFDHLTVQPSRGYGTRRMKGAMDGEVLWLRAPIEFAVAPERLMLIRPTPVPGGPALDGDAQRGGAAPAPRATCA